ncbi:RNA-directed DNA polymerase, eukaryota, partial [Tanacetum coccineum]
MLNRLPSRVNLDKRNIEVSSLLCPSCLDDLETVNHTFFNCEMAKDLWSLLAKWWDVDIPVCGIFWNGMIAFLTWHMPPKLRIGSRRCRGNAIMVYLELS